MKESAGPTWTTLPAQVPITLKCMTFTSGFWWAWFSSSSVTSWKREYQGGICGVCYVNFILRFYIIIIFVLLHGVLFTRHFNYRPKITDHTSCCLLWFRTLLYTCFKFVKSNYLLDTKTYTQIIGISIEITQMDFSLDGQNVGGCNDKVILVLFYRYESSMNKCQASWWPFAPFAIPVFV